MEIGAHQMVGGGLRGGVWTVRRERRLFGEGGLARLERTVDLVGGDVQEAECAVFAAVIPVGARFLEQTPRADDIRLHELRRTRDRAIDMALGGEMHDRARL